MNGPQQPIVVVDLRIPFIRLVFFLVKLTLAAIPASIILVLIAGLVGAALSWLMGGQMGFMTQQWRL
jgi:VIT1/CCC1 family predicted Fe2+/Mn2+ transporter